jgi:hypothetical protein
MRYSKMVGLVAFLAVLVAGAIGIGSASATVLCKKWQSPCLKAETYPENTEINATLEAGNSLEIKDTLAKPLSTCTGSTIKGKTTNVGSETEPVNGNVATLTFTGCAVQVFVLAPGQFSIDYVGPNTSGRLTLTGTRVTIIQEFTDCIYTTGAGAIAGPMTSAKEMTSPTIDFAVTLTREAGGFPCPADIIWSAKYVVTAPNPLFFKERSE